MELSTGAPMRGEMLRRLTAFLALCELDYDPGIEYTAALLSEEDEIIAAGSLDGQTLKCLAVHPDWQGMDLLSRVMTALFEEAFRRGRRALMLFTKPKNEYLFQSFGFYPVMRTASVLLMENRRSGLADFLSGLERPENSGHTGCIVAHCDPMTKGHLYLIQTAAKRCDTLHVFILSEDKGRFSPEKRLRLAREACREMPNVYVHPSGPYMISSATFPDYFIRDKSRVNEIRCELDIRIFAERVAPALGITERFVGTEPFSPTTNAYNMELKRLLPGYGIQCTEIPRLEENGTAVSATRVRALLEEGNQEALEPLLPYPVSELLREE